MDKEKILSVAKELVKDANKMRSRMNKLSLEAFEASLDCHCVEIGARKLIKTLEEEDV